MSHAPWAPISRWADKVDITEGCWLWTGHVMSNGYGQFFSGDRLVLAHRWTFELFNGAIPEGMHIDHLCSNRACVNPDHLEAVTQQENNRRAIARRGRRTHCSKGHPFDRVSSRPGGSTVQVCSTCNRETNRQYRLRKRGEVA